MSAATEIQNPANRWRIEDLNKPGNEEQKLKAIYDNEKRRIVNGIRKAGYYAII